MTTDVDPYATHHRLDPETAGDRAPDGSYTYPAGDTLSLSDTGEPIDLTLYDPPHFEGGGARPAEPVSRFEDPARTVADPGPAPAQGESFAASTRGLGEELHRALDRAEDRFGSTETKLFLRTSEFAITIAGLVTLMIAAAVSRSFDAPQLWPLCTWLVGFYVLSRGLAKSGVGRR